MQTQQTAPLTRKAIRTLLSRIDHRSETFDGTERRNAPRYPFDAQVELKSVNPFVKQKCVGDCCSLSEGGLGLSTDHYIDPNTPVELIVHTSECDFTTRAVVRYCYQIRGEFMVGAEFLLDD